MSYPTLKDFIHSKILRNSHIEEPDLVAYMRKSNRFIEGKMHEFLDIGRILVDSNKRGTGVFKKFLSDVENFARQLNRGVFIESIMEPRLIDFLKNRGYKRMPNLEDISMYFFPK
jgi:predicted GNAT family N-acyltransferase